MSLIKEPTQQRSLETQERILDAFEELLKGSFLGDITVRQIAKKAEITPATIYRRFENKDALLPVLYERYEERLKDWASAIWNPETLAKTKTIQERLGHIVKAHIAFYHENNSMIRTLYLKARTSNFDLEATDDSERKQIYETMFRPVLELAPKENSAKYVTKFPFLILVLISTINEKLLFSDQKLARLLDLKDDNFADQLAQCLTDILIGP